MVQSIRSANNRSTSKALKGKCKKLCLNVNLTDLIIVDGLLILFLINITHDESLPHPICMEVTSSNPAPIAQYETKILLKKQPRASANMAVFGSCAKISMACWAEFLRIFY
jgi:hypothetical protein